MIDRSRLQRWYHVPVLLAIMIFMFAVRVQSWQRFVRPERIYLSGNDPWYHLRQVVYTMKHWPSTMPYDVWTGYPVGAANGQFGTLYDQIVATVVILVGGFDPTARLAALVLVFVPPVAAALTAIPVYVIAKQLTNRKGGIFAAGVLSIIQGMFLMRGLAGVADHNIVEPLFMAMGVAAVTVSFAAIDRQPMIIELARDRDLRAMRAALIAPFVAGMVTALYMWVWPPGIFLVGILAVFYVVAGSIRSLRTEAIEPVMWHGIATMAGIITMVAPLADLSRTSVNGLTLPHVLLPLLVIGGLGVMIALERVYEGYDTPYMYPLTLLALGVGGVLVWSVLAPDTLRFFWRQLMRVIGLNVAKRAATIAEAQSMLSRGSLHDQLFRYYGVTVYAALVSLVGIAYRQYRDGSLSHLLVGIWFVFTFLAALTQIRFNYYLGVTIPILTAYAIYAVFRMASMPDLDDLRSISTYQVLVALIAVLVVVPSLVVPLGGTVVAQGEQTGPGASRVWQSSLDWMQHNTPPIETLEYYGRYERTTDFDYPDEAYGVMSWWDYGHWITVMAKRIPVANPFQQHAVTAAKWLLADTEAAAHRAVVDAGTIKQGDTHVRYVAVDWKMVSVRSKFGAPVVFHPNLTMRDMIGTAYHRTRAGKYQMVTLKKQRYYESLVTRLYLYHGSAMRPRPVVVNVQAKAVKTRRGTQQVPMVTGVKRYKSMQKARAYVANHPRAMIGGIGRLPHERVPALEHYRVVHIDNQSALRSSYGRHIRQMFRLAPRTIRPGMLVSAPGWVKIFERVPGATIRGQAPANTTVTAVVKLRSPTRNTTFSYRQYARTGADGTFTMTLPYSTRNDSAYTPAEGYTNVSVYATGPYRFVAGNHTATLQVGAGYVNGAKEGVLRVDLTN